MKLRTVIAVRSVWGWLADTCAGGTWVDSVEDAKTFDTRGDALDELAAAEIADAAGTALELVELVQVSR